MKESQMKETKTNKTAATSAKTGKQNTMPKRIYFCVKFSEASDEAAVQDIPLSVNGETLLIQRGKEVIIPKEFLDVAEHAKIMSRKYDPVENVMTPKIIQKFPYTVIRQATEAEFLQMKKEGTKKTIEEMKRRERMGLEGGN